MKAASGMFVIRFEWYVGKSMQLCGRPEMIPDSSSKLFLDACNIRCAVFAVLDVSDAAVWIRPITIFG